MLRRAKNCAADTARSTRERFESVGVLLDSVSRKAVNLQAQAYIAEQCGRLQRQRRIDTMISPHEGETVTARLKSRNASGNCSELLNKMVTRTCSAGTDLGALRSTRRNVFSVSERARAHAAWANEDLPHTRRIKSRSARASSRVLHGAWGKTGRCERRCGRKSRSASARSARKCGDTRTAVRGAETRAATAAESVAVTRGAARAGGRRRADSCSRTAARRAAEAGQRGQWGRRRRGGVADCGDRGGGIATDASRTTARAYCVWSYCSVDSALVTACSAAALGPHTYRNAARDSSSSMGGARCAGGNGGGDSGRGGRRGEEAPTRSWRRVATGGGREGERAGGAFGKAPWGVLGGTAAATWARAAPRGGAATRSRHEAATGGGQSGGALRALVARLCSFTACRAPIGRFRSKLAPLAPRTPFWPRQVLRRDGRAPLPAAPCSHSNGPGAAARLLTANLCHGPPPQRSPPPPGQHHCRALASLFGKRAMCGSKTTSRLEHGQSVADRVPSPRRFHTFSELL
ncbi:hypothetical protein FGB62_20g29 [Gracilaria domingensis]|nr:hypothetical protein FGB62_20g29 [Gracilaria domingensis]